MPQFSHLENGGNDSVLLLGWSRELRIMYMKHLLSPCSQTGPTGELGQACSPGFFAGCQSSPREEALVAD